MTATTSPAHHHATKMRAADMPELAIRTFTLHLERLVQGESGKLGGDEISPTDSLEDSSKFVELPSF